MSDDRPYRPGVEDLYVMIQRVIQGAIQEWDLSAAEVIGTLHIIQAQYTRNVLDDNDEED
ncbi:MAG: hypothetical protein ACOC00_00045 [Halothiobacillaceae bacterium]